MSEIPKRSSLIAQVAEIVRRDITRGEWLEFLPGELSLCDRLQVSRPTLRAALDLFRREGWIEVSQGRRRRILNKVRKPASTDSSKSIGFLTPLPYHLLSSFALYLLSELQGHLHDAGYKLEVHAHGRFRGRNPGHALGEIATANRMGCWILFGPTPAMQHWFADRELPTLVVGSPPPTVHLPSIGVDYQAIARHAVGIFLARGYSRIALLVPDPGVVGEDSWRQGFLEGFATARDRADVQQSVLVHNGTVKGIQSVLHTAFRSRTPPSALLVGRPKHVLTVMSHLMNSGIKIPDDVALISLGHDPILGEMVPSVACYTLDWGAFARRMSRMVIQTVETGAISPRKISLPSQFQDGATVQNQGR